MLQKSNQLPRAPLNLIHPYY